MAVLKDLIVHGSSRFLNKTYMNTLNINEIEADKGKFNRLLVEDVTATNATVLGLLDVKGELHTNTWTNSNIATIDGSFYITPTIGLPDGGTASVSANSISFAGTGYSLDTIYTNEATSSTTSSVSWTVGSKILVTGEVEVNGEWMPFGTLTGLLGATSSTSIAVNTLKANRPATVSSNPETLAAIISAATEAGIATSSLSYRNVKISMYQTNRANNGTTYYPLGIYMSALGANGRTFIDIYGGNNAVSATYTSAMALPVVRVGNLSSMNLPQVGGVTPNGWGIYTSNGFFSGTVAAKQGKIGDGTAAWTIGNDGNNTARIYAPSNRTAWNTNANGIWIATDVISGGAQTGSAVSGQYASTDPKWYIKANGDVKFGELTYINGTLTVPAAKVSGTLSANTMQTNILSALHAKVNALTSTTATIGSWTISKGVMQHATVGGSGGVWISADTDTSSNITVGNSGAIKNWRLLISNTFGVTSTGALYATSADISGAIKATSLSTGTKTASTTGNGTFIDSNGNIYVGNGSTNNFTVTAAGAVTASNITATGGYIGSYKINSQYLQAADETTGMSIKDDSNTKDWAFWAGGTTKETAKFRVTHDGDLYAQSLFVNIGGRNLIKGTQNPVISSTGTQYTWLVQSGGDGTGTIETVTDSPVPSVSRSFRITGNTSGNKDFVQKTDEFQKNWGGQWTFSAYVRGIGGNATVLIRSWNNTDNNSAFTYTKTVGTSWEKVIVRIPIDISWNSSASASDTLDIRFGMIGAGAIEYIAPKFEQGIVATDWSPAPEDSITSWKINANDIKNKNTSKCTLSVSNDVVTITRLDSSSVFGCYYDFPCKPNKYYSVSMRVTSGSGFQFYFGGDYGSGSVWTGMGVAFQRQTNGIRRATIYKPTSSTQTYIRIYIGSNTQNSTMSFRDLTVYEGDDLMLVDRDAEDAAKTATSYITYINSSDGIKVHNAEDTTNYLQINSTAIKMYRNNTQKMYLDNSKLQFTNGNTVLAEFGTNVTIGQNTSGKFNTFIDSNGVYMRKATANLGKFDGTGVYFYDSNGTQTAKFSNSVVLGNPQHPSFEIVDENTMTIREDPVVYNFAVTAANKSYSLTWNTAFPISEIVEITCHAFNVSGSMWSTSQELDITLTPSSPSYTNAGTFTDHSLRYTNTSTSVVITLANTKAGSTWRGVISKISIAYKTTSQDASRVRFGFYSENNYGKPLEMGGGTSTKATDTFSVDWFGNILPVMSTALIQASDYTITTTASGVTVPVPCRDTFIVGDCFEEITISSTNRQILILKTGYYSLYVDAVWSSISSANGVKRTCAFLHKNGGSESTIGTNALGRPATWEIISAESIVYLEEGDEVRMDGSSEGGNATLYSGKIILRPVWLLSKVPVITSS